MNKKIAVFTFLAVFMMTSIMPCLAQAGDYKGKGGHHKDLEQKINYKAKFMLRNEDELGLSDKQIDEIKAMKYATKREIIKQNAAIDIAKINAKEKLYTDKINVAEMDSLIDKKYDLKKEKAKYLVKQYAALKGMLTDEQMEKMKTIWKQSCKK